MRLSAFLVVLLFLEIAVQAHGASILQTKFFGGHTYYLVGADADGNGINWTDAEAFANTLSAHLVTVDDDAENDFLLVPST